MRGQRAQRSRLTCALLVPTLVARLVLGGIIGAFGTLLLARPVVEGSDPLLALGPCGEPGQRQHRRPPAKRWRAVGHRVEKLVERRLRSSNGSVELLGRVRLRRRRGGECHPAGWILKGLQPLVAGERNGRAHGIPIVRTIPLPFQGVLSLLVEGIARRGCAAARRGAHHTRCETARSAMGRAEQGRDQAGAREKNHGGSACVGRRAIALASARRAPRTDAFWHFPCRKPPKYNISITDEMNGFVGLRRGTRNKVCMVRWFLRFERPRLFDNWRRSHPPLSGVHVVRLATGSAPGRQQSTHARTSRASSSPSQQGEKPPWSIQARSSRLARASARCVATRASRKKSLLPFPAPRLWRRA